MKTTIRLAPLPALLLLFAVGCGGGSSRSAELSGKVLYKNAPVTGGSMTLYIGDAGYPVTINPDGSYSANQLPVGEAVVTIDTEALNTNQPAYGGKQGSGMSPVPEGANPGSVGKYVKIPEKYKSPDKSDLKITLKKGKQEKDLTLTD